MVHIFYHPMGRAHAYLKNRKAISYGVVFLLWILLLSNAPGCSKKKNERSEPGEKKSPSEVSSSIPVKLRAVKRDSIEIFYHTSGTVKAVKEAFIGAEITGTLSKIYVEEGDRVLKDATLAELDKEDLFLKLNQAKTALSSAKARVESQELSSNHSTREWERAQKLFKENAISQQAYDQIEDAYTSGLAALKLAKANYEEVQANLTIIEDHLKKTLITAPFSGLIAHRFVNEAENVHPSPSQPLFKLIDDEGVEVTAHLPQEKLSTIKVGNKVEVFIEEGKEGSGEVLSGTIDRINSILDPQRRTFIIKVFLPNTRHLLYSGMFVRLKILEEKKVSVLVIPTVALMEEKEDKFVFIVDSSKKARLREVKIGLRNLDMCEIREGLSEGDHIIIDGHYNLKPGSIVDSISDVSL
ncbi:MAG: efflux RND transporter periplasmic adaptor subunit [bacterium]